MTDVGMAELFRLDGKVAVVTGGGRGIGVMIARGLLQAGAAKVYLSARKEAELAAAVEELSPLGVVEAIPADLGTEAGVQALTDAVSAREDQIHALFNNAGANWGEPFETFPAAAFDRVFDVNVKGVFLLTRALVPLLNAGATEADPARVINTGSVDGFHIPEVGRNNFSYAASKAAVHALTQQLAGELAPRILVNAIAPGLFPSKMTKVLLTAGEEAVGAALPLKRVGQPDDMAGIAVFLASRASSYVTGTVIPVDGGISVIR
ncbi:SDR family oxidoreductase [Mycolicibacterium diernhoferi]